MQLDSIARNGAAQNISRKSAKAPHPGKLPVEAIRKVFPPAAEGEFVQNFPRRKTFDIIVASASCSGLAEKTSELFIRRSTDWLWPREERKGNIGICRLWFACCGLLLHNALKMFLLSPRSRKSKSCPVESLELAAEEKYWSLEVQGDLATPPQRNTREILSSPLLQFGFSLPADAGWLILRVGNAVHRF